MDIAHTNDMTFMRGGVIDYSRVFGLSDPKPIYFIDQVKIHGGKKPFAIPGDSGSLVLETKSLRPLGLACMVAGDNIAICNKIENVMTALEIPRI